MKWETLYFVQVFSSYYGGFNVLKSPVVVSSSNLPCVLSSSPCVIMLGPPFLSVTNTSDLGSIICSCM